MRLFLDSSVIVQTGLQLGSNSFSTLRAFAVREEVELITSQVVIKEVVNKYRQRVTEEIERATASVDKLARTTDRHFAVTISDDDVPDLVEVYRRELVSLFEGTGGWILPYPDVDHELLVDRAVENTKPFGGKNDGYRDALIWFSVLDALAQAKEHELEVLYFGTGNSNDFATNRGSSRFLHSDLTADMVDRGFMVDDVILFGSLGDIISNQVTYRMRELAAVKERIRSGVWKQGGFTRDIENAVAGYVQTRPESVLPWDVDWDFLDATHSSIVEYRDVGVVSAGLNLYRVEVVVRGKVRLAAYLLPGSEIPVGWVVKQSDLHDGPVISGTHTLSLTVSFVFDEYWTEVSVAVWSEEPGDLELLSVEH